MAPLESPTPSSSVQSQNIEKPPPNFLQRSSQQGYHSDSQKQTANSYPIFNLKQPLLASGAVQPISTYAAAVPTKSFFPQYLPQPALHVLPGSFQKALITPGQGNLFADALHNSLNLFDTPFPRVKPIQSNPPTFNPAQLSHPNINPISASHPGNAKLNLPQNNALNQGFFQNKPIFPVINNQPIKSNGNLQAGVPIIPHYQKPIATSNGYQLPPITNGKFSVPAVIHNIETPPVAASQDESNNKSENTDESANNNEEEKDDGSNNEEEEDDDEEEADENENTDSEDEDDGKQNESSDDEFWRYKALIDSQFNDEEDGHHYQPWSSHGHEAEDDEGYEDHGDGDYEGDASEKNVKYHEHDLNSSGSEKKENLQYKKRQYTKPKFYKKGDKYGKKTSKYSKNTQPVLDSVGANSNIPVIHKQKVYKERWFVSEDSHDSTEPKS
ncbi:uncharacterized protein LOC143190898 isoform X1 [Rhynchophorus ferrugineus]|uniref:uncharacterized protein LOC143190898 isoform X1 n=1 Tax=Rhynchophorus ferrugineus TaxID=354439 RepID=UPI003FCC2CDC